MQDVELGLALLRVGGQQLSTSVCTTCSPSDSYSATVRSPSAAEIAVQPLQRQRQQRQRISPFGGLGEEPIHQRRFDLAAPGCGGTPGRAVTTSVYPAAGNGPSSSNTTRRTPASSEAVCSGSYRSARMVAAIISAGVNPGLMLQEGGQKLQKVWGFGYRRRR